MFSRRAAPQGEAGAPSAVRAAPAATGRWRRAAPWGGGAVLTLVLILFATGWFWSREPATYLASFDARATLVGETTTSTLIAAIDWLLTKRGGYLSNDIMPPGAWLDNMPNFEYGVLVQCRDLARVLRNDYSRSQSQSTEDPDLAVAEPALNFSNDSWIFPATESKLREALGALGNYRLRMADPLESDAQFFARADNLREWLAVVERRLGSLSQRLSASVGQTRVNTDLAGDPTAAASTPQGNTMLVRTPWLQIDDIFYEARGTAWALLQFLAATQVDFDNVLTDKNAVVSLQQIMRELEGALEPVGSPMILNGSGFGFFPNHSLVLASYLSRAHAAVIDLRELLEQG